MTTMNPFSETICRYGLTSATDDFYAAASKASKCYAESAFFQQYLTEEYLQKIDHLYLNLPAEAMGALVEAADLLSKEPALCQLAGCAWWLLFKSGCGVEELAAMGFPRPSASAPLLNDLFGLLVHLGGIDEVEKRYQARHIPLEYMQASYRSVRIWMESFHVFFGRWGHNRECPRMVYIENFRFIRIGRLEYEMGYLSAQVHVFRSRQDGRVLIGSTGGVRINSAGHVQGTNNEILPITLETIWQEDDTAYLLNLATAECTFAAEPTRLLKAQWQHIACPGTRCIGVHIPRDGRLNEDAVRASLQEAAEYFRKYFPEWDFCLFQCHSWLLDPIYRTLLGEQSNIVRFQRIFCCLPEKSNDLGAMLSVFTEAPFEIQKWHPESTLQKRLQEYYLKGGKVAAAAGIFYCNVKQPE